MLRTRRFAAVFALAVCAVSPLAIPSADAKKPVIISSSSTATALTINGEDLAPGAASVLLGSFGPLAVTGQTPTQLVVTLPGGLTPGNYVLSVQIGNGKGNIDESVVTIGATDARGVCEFADFYAMMPPDNAATVAAGAAVQFPNDGPTSAAIVRNSASSFTLPSAGTYQIMFEVSVTEAGQLVLERNGAELPYTVVGRATGTSQIVGMSLVTASAGDSISVRNPAGSSTALTITPLAGGVAQVSAHLVITQLRCAAGP